MDHAHGRKDMDATNREDTQEVLEQAKIDDTIESMSTIRSVFTNFKKEESGFSKEDLRKAEKQLRLVFAEFYHTLLHLKNYR